MGHWISRRKNSSKEEMDYFTSDTHFSHGNILKYCKRVKYLESSEVSLLNKEEDFKVSPNSVRAMDDDLIKEINKIVKPNDVLWHLGDFCWYNRKNLDKAYYQISSFRNAINCKTVNLILGNHDCNRLEEPELLEVYEAVFNKVLDKAIVRINGQHIVMDHYAHAVWAKSHRQGWNLYGHSHSNAEKNLDKILPGRRSIDVGVDNAYLIFGEYRPFSFVELQKFFATKKGFIIDHHKDENQ